MQRHLGKCGVSFILYDRSVCKDCMEKLPSDLLRQSDRVTKL